MLGLVIAFGVVWMAAILSGVTKTIRRRHAGRRGTAVKTNALSAVANLKSEPAGTPSESESAWPSKLSESSPTLQGTHAATRSSSGQAVDAPAAEGGDENYDHPGDSVFATPALFWRSRDTTSVQSAARRGPGDGTTTRGRAVGDSDEKVDAWFVNPLRLGSMSDRPSLAPSGVRRSPAAGDPDYAGSGPSHQSREEALSATLRFASRDVSGSRSRLGHR